jgi:hypothetical protein
LKESDSTARTSEIVDTRTTEIIDIGRMPTSCADLERMGHKLSGFFSVKGSKKMEMIYCNFFANQNGTTCFNFICHCSSKSFLFTDKQKWIGYADVKSAPVHFYVTRNSNFKTVGTPIPFELARVNEGNAMNLTSGIFTALRPGIYYFSFTGVARLLPSSSNQHANFYSRLYLNGNLIGSSRVQESNSPVNQYSVLSLQSTLNLKKGDQLWMQMEYSPALLYLSEDGGHSTHFTGFMLEEEIMVSL